MGYIRYVSTGTKAPPVQVSASMNNGLSWQKKELKAGQSFPIPPKCTNLFIGNVPFDPEGNFEIRQGIVIQK